MKPGIGSQVVVRVSVFFFFFFFFSPQGFSFGAYFSRGPSECFSQAVCHLQI